MNSLLLGVLGTTTLLFIFNVNDGTFLKPIALYLFSSIIVTAMLCRTIGRQKLEFSYSTIHIVFGLYIISSAISLLRAENIYLGLESILQLCCYFIIFSASASSLNKSGTSIFLITLTVLTCAISLAHNFVPDSSSAINIFRQISLISTFGNQSYFAGFLIIVLPIAVSQIMMTEDFLFRKGALAILVIVIVYLLMITESRSAWIAAIISMLIFVTLNFTSAKKRWIGGGIIFTLAILAGIMFPDIILRRMNEIFEFSAQSSIARRLFFYEGAWKAFLSSPVIGRGIGNFILFLPRFRSPDYWMFRSEDIVPHAHNEFLEILSETGVIGFVCYSMLLGLFIYKMIGAIKQQSGHERTMLIGYFCAIIAVLIDSFASMNLRTIPVAVAWWMLTGLSLQQSTIKVKTFAVFLPAFIPRSLRWLPPAFCVIFIVIAMPKIYNLYLSEKSYLEGILFRMQHDSKNAEIKFHDVIERRPRHAEARLYLAAQLIENNRFEEAENNIRAILSLYPYYPKARTLGAICSFELGDTASAFKQIDTELSLERSPQVLYYASYLSRRAHRDPDESQYLSELLSQDIKSGVNDFAIQGIERLGEVYDVISSEREHYITLLEQLDRRFFSDAEVSFALGTCYRRLGMLTEAEQSLIRAAHLQPGNILTQQTLADVKEEIKQQKSH